MQELAFFYLGRPDDALEGRYSTDDGAAKPAGRARTTIAVQGARVTT